jgi:hypothetical protein
MGIGESAISFLNVEERKKKLVEVVPEDMEKVRNFIDALQVITLCFPAELARKEIDLIEVDIFKNELNEWAKKWFDDVFAFAREVIDLNECGLIIPPGIEEEIESPFE